MNNAKTAWPEALKRLQGLRQANLSCQNGFLIGLCLQVVFSSSVMYANFLTISQRRAIAEIAKEHAARSALHQKIWMH